jgi:DnaJ-class molecular chaperone
LLVQVKDAYRRIAQKYHPDLVEPNLRPAAENYFKEVTSAYQSLSNGKD